MSDEFLQHEALDRLFVAECHLQEFVYSHPFIDDNKELSKLVEDAMYSLAKAYQKVGNLKGKEDD